MKQQSTVLITLYKNDFETLDNSRIDTNGQDS